MLSWACICIEVCRKHDEDLPCPVCKKEYEKMTEMTEAQTLHLTIKICTVPFHKALLSMLTLGLTDK